MPDKKDKEKYRQQLPEWFRLDNAAAIFPGQNSNSWSNIFRFSVELKEEINPELLKTALTKVLPRFPGFDVRIRRGFFWYYFEKNPLKSPPVNVDIKNPCHRINFKENNRYLFRVYYYGNHIAVDTYHAVTDGHGGAVFTCTLVAEYLRLSGKTVSTGGMVYDIAENPSKKELEDSFIKNAVSKGKIKRSDKFVYHAVGTKLPRHFVNITSGTVSFEEIHKLSSEKGVTVTEFFAALLLRIHYEKQLRENRKQKEISVQIPIDLRRVYGSQTLRNFTICLRVKIDPKLGDYTFDELLTLVSLQLRLAKDEKKLNAMVTANTAIERNPLLKFIPLTIKDIGVGISFFITGEQTTTALLSNLGKVDLPEDMLPFVEKVLFMPGPGKLNAARCGVATVGDKLVFTFADIYEENDIEREFFTRLVKMGVHVKIESNRG